ncbi:Spermidine/putrescine transport system permease protein PotC [Trichinella spiralis]|uniref:Spermidine/putrescine transport system permease protein PotC n=1 Tax=Trichinella spiralis TaxID=6334 RepID=A0ABR3KAY3_TRISP
MSIGWFLPYAEVDRSLMEIIQYGPLLSMDICISGQTGERAMKHCVLIFFSLHFVFLNFCPPALVVCLFSFGTGRVDEQMVKLHSGLRLNEISKLESTCKNQPTDLSNIWSGWLSSRKPTVDLCW